MNYREKNEKLIEKTLSKFGISILDSWDQENTITGRKSKVFRFVKDNRRFDHAIGYEALENVQPHPVAMLVEATVRALNPCLVESVNAAIIETLIED